MNMNDVFGRVDSKIYDAVLENLMKNKLHWYETTYDLAKRLGANNSYFGERPGDVHIIEYRQQQLNQMLLDEAKTMAKSLGKEYRQAFDTDTHSLGSSDE